MDRQAFREELHRALREILLERIHSYCDQRFEAHRQLARYMSALDKKYDSATIIKEGVLGVLTKLDEGAKKEAEGEFISTYLSAVDQLAENFPAEAVWLQDEDRFTIQDGDSWLISVGKSGKRVGRSVSYSWHQTTKRVSKLFNGSVNGWEPWTQRVPLQRLIRFHLQDEEIVGEWMVVLERIQLKIITEIEDLLVTHAQTTKNVGLSEFTESLQDMLETKRMAIDQQVVDAVNKMESEIYWKVKKAGTIERSGSFYDQQRMVSHRDHFKEQLQNIQQQWTDIQQLLLDRSREVARFINLGSDIEQQSKDFSDDFLSTLQQYLDHPLGELSDLLEKAIQQVDQKDPSDAVLDLKNKLATFVEDQLTLPIQKLLGNQVLSRKVEHFFEELLLQAAQVPQQTTLLLDSKLETNLPTVNQKQVEWRLLVVRALREQLINPLQPNQQAYEDFLARALEDVREIEDVIEVNLESALSVEEAESGEDEVEHPAKIAREALKRILTNVEDLQSRVAGKSTVIEEIVYEGSKDFTSSLLDLLHEGDVKELQLLNAKYKVKETTKNWQTALDSRWARAQDRLMVWSRFGWQKSKKYGSNIREFAGFQDQEVTESKRMDIASYLSETDQKIKALPYIYRRLFDFNAQADERFYVPAPESTTTFKKAFEQWQQSFPATFAIVGEKGSGKSTFLNLAQKSEVDQVDVLQIDLEDTIWREEDLVEKLFSALGISEASTIQDIVEKINSEEQRRVVYIEGIQNCFVRNINGYEAVEKLCYLISETKGRVFWAVSCSRYAWHFLDKIVQISEYFSHIAMSDILNADQIKSVISDRHRASGYTLIFEPAEQTLKSRAYRKLKDQEEQAQEHLQANYFQKLAELAEGNASVAMIFWIRSIRSFDDTYFYIQPLEVKSIELIENLSPQVLFALAAFVLHDTLSDDDLSKVLNLANEESRLLLNRLHSRGLLEKKEGMYTINHLMYRQIMRVLKERNIIHLV